MSKKRRIRRLWEDDEKIRIVAQTRVPGVSVSQVARRYDVNANLVFTWRCDPRFNPPPVEDPAANDVATETPDLSPSETAQIQEAGDNAADTAAAAMDAMAQDAGN